MKIKDKKFYLTESKEKIILTEDRASVIGAFSQQAKTIVNIALFKVTIEQDKWSINQLDWESIAYDLVRLDNSKFIEGITVTDGAFFVVEMNGQKAEYHLYGTRQDAIDYMKQKAKTLNFKQLKLLKVIPKEKQWDIQTIPLTDYVSDLLN